MAAVSLLTRKYNQYYAARPVLTTMITNAVRATPLHEHNTMAIASRCRAITASDAATSASDPTYIQT
jgi:hypothetical protein